MASRRKPSIEALKKAGLAVKDLLKGKKPLKLRKSKYKKFKNAKDFRRFIENSGIYRVLSPEKKAEMLTRWMSAAKTGEVLNAIETERDRLHKEYFSRTVEAKVKIVNEATKGQYLVMPNNRIDTVKLARATIARIEKRRFSSQRKVEIFTRLMSASVYPEIMRLFEAERTKYLSKKKQ